MSSVSCGREGIPSHWRNFYQSGQKQSDSQDIRRIVCLWEVGLTDENPESSPLPKGAQEVFGHKNFFAAFWSPIRFIA